MKKNNLIVLQNGVPRSGNLWVYKIIEEILSIGGVDHRSFIKNHSIYNIAKQWDHFEQQAGIDYLEITPDGYFIRKGKYQEPITEIGDYLDKCSHIWTHSKWCERTETIFQRVDKVVYIVRDPRDVAVSASRYVFTPFMIGNHPVAEKTPMQYLDNRIYEIVINWVNHLGQHLLQSNRIPIYFIFFERLNHLPEKEIFNLGQYLGINLHPIDIDKIISKVNFEVMKKENPYHLHRGTSGKWVKDLKNYQKRRVIKIAGPMLKLVNYPIDYSGDLSLPLIELDLGEKQIFSAIKKSKGTFLDQIIYGYYWLRSGRPISEKILKGWQYIMSK
jgi:aryl sulfotransferase